MFEFYADGMKDVISLNAKQTLLEPIQGKTLETIRKDLKTKEDDVGNEVKDFELKSKTRQVNIRGGQKPEFFQNPGFGSNPGFK